MEERVGSLRRIQADFSSGGGAALRQKLSAGGAVLYGAGKCAETRRPPRESSRGIAEM